MLPSEIINAWKNDEEYQTNTGASQRHLPDNPAGLNSLTDEEIAGVVAGGTGTTLTTITTIFITWITCGITTCSCLVEECGRYGIPQSNL